MEGCMSSFGGMSQGSLCEGLAQLKSEHTPLLSKLEGLFELTQKIELEDHIDVTFQQLINDVKVFITELDPHSQREEGVLFEMMEKYIGRNGGPIAVMEYEHDQAKNYIGTFLEKTSLSSTFSIDDQKIFADLIKNAYFTLTQHFAKEENVLFPMAERMLSDEEKEELLIKIREI
ncbi:hemerythrin domain-containing protein [Neobacillus sp. D3-1R]|uniref:hemerythrin domain-containing protein n=1 Tax=Neobacillus sp. D3-1R TaxID=3445778 RepID=UPI003F9FD6AE